MTKLIPKCQTGKFIGLQWVPTTSPASTQPYNGVIATIGPDRSNELPVGQRRHVKEVLEENRRLADQINAYALNIGEPQITEAEINDPRQNEAIKAEWMRQSSKFPQAVGASTALIPISGISLGGNILKNIGQFGKQMVSTPEGLVITGATLSSSSGEDGFWKDAAILGGPLALRFVKPAKLSNKLSNIFKDRYTKHLVKVPHPRKPNSTLELPVTKSTKGSTKGKFVDESGVVYPTEDVLTKANKSKLSLDVATLGYYGGLAPWLLGAYDDDESEKYQVTSGQNSNKKRTRSDGTVIVDL